MKNRNNIFKTLFLSFLCIFPLKVLAGSGSLGLSGSSSVQPNASFNLSVVGNSNAGNLMGIGGTISSSNTSCIQVTSVSKSISGSDANGMKFSYLDMTGFTGSKTIVNVNLKAVGASCTSVISINGPTLSFTDGTNLKPATISKTITVTAPLSTNNNLKALSVSEGSISPSFSAGNTNYTVNVKENVSSITINATAEDGTASISGTGHKSLNYGANKFTITVKAQNGATKNYNITVNREDSRSNDANLKSLRVSNGSLSPSFSAGTTTYNVEVPYNITKLNISADAADEKAKVTINNPDLVAESTTSVTIRVTAENGATKTYTINVKRGKDPNKVLNTDNNLVSLKPSIGMISPAFDVNKTNYFIYLPFEVETISFDYEVSDKIYAKVSRTGEERLKPNSANKFTFAVTAEDESVKTYTVTVYRAINPEEQYLAVNGTEEESKLRLKNLKINNGKLIEKFDSNVMTYTYTKKKDFSYEYELLDETAYVTTYETEHAIYIVLESDRGDMVVYCLHEKETNITTIILIVIIILLALLSGYFIFDKIKKDKKPKK